MESRAFPRSGRDSWASRFWRGATQFEERNRPEDLKVLWRYCGGKEEEVDGIFEVGLGVPFILVYTPLCRYE